MQFPSRAKASMQERGNVIGIDEWRFSTIGAIAPLMGRYQARQGKNITGVTSSFPNVAFRHGEIGPTPTAGGDPVVRP
jgi:hypothetical protein